MPGTLRNKTMDYKLINNDIPNDKQNYPICRSGSRSRQMNMSRIPGFFRDKTLDDK